MRVLLLTPRPQLLARPLIKAKDDFAVSTSTPDCWPKEVDYIVSFGYRHIIKEPVLSQYAGRLLNIHLSMLPWNRGADPNFWSWFNDTPKGVSFHLVDKGIDTGPIVMQCEVSKWHNNATLRSSYDFLSYCAEQVFAKEWPRFRSGDYFFIEPEGVGSFHRSSEKDQWMNTLPRGWDTPVSEITAMGKATRQ